MKCKADAHPEASFEIIRNETGEPVKNEATYTIVRVNKSDVGYYKCVATNLLRSKPSRVLYLALEGKISCNSI